MWVPEDLVLHRILYGARLADESEEGERALRMRLGGPQNAQNFNGTEGCVLAFANDNQCCFFALLIHASS